MCPVQWFRRHCLLANTFFFLSFCSFLSFFSSCSRSDDAGALEVVLNHVTQQITEMTSDIQALKIANTQQDQARGGPTYTLIQSN